MVGFGASGTRVLISANFDLWSLLLLGTKIAVLLRILKPDIILLALYNVLQSSQ